MIDRQHITNEIKRTAEANGGIPLGTERFFAETGIRTSDWFGKYWARWGDALIEAGYKPNEMQGSYEDDWVIEKLISVIRELGRFPSSGDLRLKAKQEKDFPSHNVFNRVGKKAELVRKTIEYCCNRGGFDNVLKICEKIAVTIHSEPNGTQQRQTELGYVYLMKSGRYYKIGRTASLGRREYELGIQLPEPPKTIHSIKTDDPPGIEAYWHKRFEAKRKGGEWFELSKEDVEAFRRRKFM